MVLPELPASVIRRATAADIAAIEALVEAAYEHYIPRIGMRPIPMDDDYPARVDRGEAFVTGDDAIDGVIVLVERDDHVLIDNVAVHPAKQGRGTGRALLAFAEERASQLGFDEVRLYTHAKMVENRALYARLGYEQTGDDEFVGRPRVHMRKRL